ncbi:hypothetical protein HDV00_008478 [Rhizophlyctis rosea]|nr:hypothetical protein HDV00_008478 [Rhizophlyctis rosea]
MQIVAVIMSQVQPTPTKENCVQMLRQFVEGANLKGAYTLKEANLLGKAIDVVDPAVKTKPILAENDPNPRLTALKLLTSAAHKAQAAGSFLIKDSSLLYDVVELVNKEVEVTEKSDANTAAAEEK